MRTFKQLRSTPFDKRALRARSNLFEEIGGRGAVSLVLMRAGSIERAGVVAVFAALPLIYFWFGGMKFTSYEANGLVPLVENSPFLSWAYAVFSVQGFSNLLGALEITIGLLIASRLFSPVASAIGAALSVGLFATTVSLLFTTPGAFEQSLGFPALTVAPGQFLLKDVGLFAASLFALGSSLQAIAARRAS